MKGGLELLITKMACIYKVVNTKNGKFYLGSTKYPDRRQKRHFRQLRSGTHHSIALQRAWDKYGSDYFTFEIVETCENSEVKTLEQKYLDNEDCHYNISKQSSGGDLISYHPNKKRIIKKISESSQQNWNSEEYREKMPSREGSKNPNWKGGVVKEKRTCECGNKKEKSADKCIECYDKSGKNNPFHGKSHSKETKQKISEAKKGKYHGDQNKRVVANDKTYDSLSKAASDQGITVGAVHNRLNSENFPNWNYL